MGLTLILSSVWLGIMTSLSPCPLTTNVVALSYMGQKIGKPYYVLLSGLFYTLGRATLYTLLGFALSLSLASIPLVSHFLQANMVYIVAPTLILVGLVILDVLKIKLPRFFVKERLQSSLAKRGLIGSFSLGVLLALALCPVSAALFFGNLIQSQGNILALVFYGIGTGMPVLILAFVLAFSFKSVAKVYAKILVFVVGGFYYLVTMLGLSLNILSWFTLLADLLVYHLLALGSPGRTTVVSFFRSGSSQRKSGSIWKANLSGWLISLALWRLASPLG